ncbi:hypothetical protein OIU83_17865 [Flavobacterium sp. LS1R49]|uniref:Uncharacterized protein n=1 Tax=Flavobacterium shii TaxID=2987687 RepID=A0A9X3C7W7_9FLAO|nr:hypothetical protein [Flavobacterium shii]MCV9929533.1 hypothetical protein [Flavobacterium shii]
MKKITLFLLLLAVSFTAYSQKTYSIDRPLQLETVTKGIKKDSVLVRGSDKIVRFIPRSELGGSLTLDQTLGFGSTAINKSITIKSSDGWYETILGLGGLSVKDPLSGANSFIQQGNISVSFNSKFTYIRPTEIRNSGGGFTNVLSWENSIPGTFGQIFQSKSGTIALTSDIIAAKQTLQQVFNQTPGVASATYSDVIGNTTTSLIVAVPASGNQATGFTGQIPTSGAEILIQNGEISLNQKVISSAGILGQSQLSFETPITGSGIPAKIKIPAKAPRVDPYVLTTMDDVSLTNAMKSGIGWGSITSPNGLNTVNLQTSAFNNSVIGYIGSQYKDISDNNIQKAGSIISADGRLEFTERYTPDGGVSDFKTKLYFQQPLSDSYIYVPSPAIGGTYALALAKDLALLKPYKVWVGTLTNNGTNAPTGVVNENTLGGTLVWTRTGIGEYTGTLMGAFNPASGKTNLVVNGSGVTANGFFGQITGSANTVVFKTYVSGAASDNVLNGFTWLEIRVYP